MNARCLSALLAAAVVLTAARSGADPETLQCHKVKDGQKFKGASVSIDAVKAAFDLPAGCTVKGKATEYCVTADTAVTSPGDAPVPPVVPDGQDLSGDGFLCYKVKCPAQTIGAQSVTDAFGYRSLTFKTAGKVCMPVVEGIATTTTTLDPCVDVDGDGWSPCDGDCCETPSCAGGIPEAYINPGALEVVGNGVDDDCDVATSDTLAAADCSSGQKLNGVTADDLAQALDICQTTTLNPPLASKKWGLISASLLLANGNVPNVSQLLNMQTYQGASLVNYGTVITPRKGPSMAGISTGRMRDQGDAGWLNPDPGSDFGVNSLPPSGWFAANGNAFPSTSCNGSACPSDTTAKDPINLRLSIRVPTNATSFSYDTRFFAVDYGTGFYCSQYNDVYLGLLASAATGNPADGNIARDSGGGTMTMNDLTYDVCAPAGCHTCPLGTTELAGTGMQTSGGGTTWITETANVVPGEVIQLELMIFDSGDPGTDSVALMDKFRWNPAPGVEP